MRVGIVGAGQLARMMLEAASAIGVDVVVLAEDRRDSAAAVAGHVILGSPTDGNDLGKLAEACDVVTFDHEQVDLPAITALERSGRTIRPGSVALQVAVDKARMRTDLAAAGIPVPAFAVLPSPGPPVAGRTGSGVAGPSGGGGEGGDRADQVARSLRSIERFAAEHGWPVVVKAARGGYDGKGVWPVADRHEAHDVCRRAAEHGTPLIVEELVPITAEIAVLVARRPGGQMAAWPAVETAQVDGVCRQVLAPAQLDPGAAADAVRLAERVVGQAGAVGVMAVELFCSGGTLLVNEVAARPHNSGHWTLDGSVTSQFENHLRGVLDLPLGDTALTFDHVASVNVFGAEDGTDPRDRLGSAMAVPGAHVHLYGKAARPGRKLGHVTVCGSEPDEVLALAWKAASSLGTPEPAATGLARVT